jgi:hypothetical protein|tara:strand:- start:118 stop:342 length:225 start_codon:yes stop_codon:yes gene_type:complete
MLEIDRNLQFVILVFFATIFILYRQKPAMIFKTNGKPKEFGSGRDKTIAPVWLIALTISLLFYVQSTVKNDDFV